jgi:hypothetical protein
MKLRGVVDRWQILALEGEGLGVTRASALLAAIRVPAIPPSLQRQSQ